MKLVYVRGFGGEVAPMALLEVAPPIAFVCLEGEFEAISLGRREWPIFGYRLESIFESPDLSRSLAERELADA